MGILFTSSGGFHFDPDGRRRLDCNAHKRDIGNDRQSRQDIFGVNSAIWEDMQNRELGVALLDTSKKRPDAISLSKVVRWRLHNSRLLHRKKGVAQKPLNNWGKPNGGRLVSLPIRAKNAGNWH